MIIDTHVHFGSILGFEMKKDAVLYAMENYGISKMLVSNCESSECDFDQNRLPYDKQVPQLLSAERTVNFARDNPGKIYAAIWLKPLNEECDARLQMFIKGNLDVIKALKFHPYHSAVPFDDPRVEAYMDLAETYELPVITHTGSSNCDNVDRVLRMAKRHPNVKFIMAHLGLGTDNQRAIEIAVEQPNIYGDTAWVPMMSTIQFMNQAGPDKLLFGSDTPIDGPDTYARNRYGQRSLYQDYFFELPKYISKENYDKLMYKNAQRIFKL